MVQFAGKYKLEKSENFVDYLKAIGFPEELAKKGDTPGITTDVVVDGDKYTFTSSTGLSTTYNVGQAFEEKMPGIDVTLKSTAKKDGNVIIVTSTAPDGRTGERKYQFSDNGYVVTLTASGIAASRHFVRV